MAGKAEDFLDSAEGFLDALDTQPAPTKADDFLESGRERDPAYLHYPKALGRGAMQTMGGVGAYIERKGVEKLAGPAPVQTPSRDVQEAAADTDFATGENPFTAAMESVAEKTGKSVDQMVEESDVAQTRATRKAWDNKLAKETPEARQRRVTIGKSLAGYGRAFSDKAQEYADDYFPADQQTQSKPFDERLSDDTTRAVLTAIVENAPNTAMSLGAAKIMGKLGKTGAYTGAAGSSYVLESGDIFQTGVKFLEQKYGGFENVPDHEFGRLIEVSQAHGLFNAGLDALMPGNIANAAARRQLADRAIQKLMSGKSAKEIGGSTIKNAFLELAPELVQEDSAIVGESRIGIEHTPKDIANRKLQAAIAGGGIGGITGAASGVSDIRARNAEVSKAGGEPPRAEDFLDNVEDVLSGEARGAKPADPAYLPPPRMIVTPEGEAVPESQYVPRTTDGMGLEEVAGAVQGRAPLPEIEPSVDESARDPEDLIKVISRAGGLSRGEAKSQGIDPAVFTDQRSRQVFGRPLFPKQGGMTMDGLAEFLSQRGFLPEGQYSANEALDLVDRALRGEKIFSTYSAADAFEKQAAQREADMREQSGGQAGPVGLNYRADDLRSRITAVQKNRVKSVLGDDAARLWEPKPDDFALSGYIKESPDVQDLAASMYEGRRIMGDNAFEAFFERFSTQNADLDGDAFESKLTSAIRSHGNAQKPGDAEENRPGAGRVEETAQPRVSQERENPQASPPDQAGQEVTPPASADRSARQDRPETRRQNTEQRKSVAQMSPDELRRELLTDSLTGLPNRRAYDESTKKPVQVAIDLDSLKWINDSMGHESGDKALSALGQALRESGLEAYHISGDEFMVQGEDRAAIESGMTSIRSRLDNAVIHFEHPDGSTTTKTGVHFSYGIGATRNEADTALSTDKANREASGRRAARGEAPGGVERRAKGQQDNQDRPAASQEVTPPEQPAESRTARAGTEPPSKEGVSLSAPEKTEAKPDPSPQADMFAPMVEAAKAMTEAANALKSAVEKNPEARTASPVAESQAPATPEPGERSVAPTQDGGAPGPVAEETAKSGEVSSSPVDEAAHEAATSPENDIPQPTEAQKDAGNYTKGHVTIGGLDIAIENPAGSKRRPEWPDLKSHYGYFKRTEGKDGDQVDVFIKPGTPEDYSGPVFVVDQTNKDGKFDEHKVMLGFDSGQVARAGYLENYTPGWTGLGAMRKFSLGEFKLWLRSGNTKKPVALQGKKLTTPGAEPVKASVKALTPELSLKLNGLYKVAENAQQAIRKFDPKPGPSGEYVHVSRAKATTRNARADMAAELWQQKRKEFGKALRDAAQQGYEIPQKYIDLAGSAFEYDESGKYSPVKPDTTTEGAPVVEPTKQDAATVAAEHEEHDAFIDRMYKGEVTPDEIKAHFQKLLDNKDAITAQLNALTKDKLLKMLGGMAAHRYKSETKARIVGQVYDSMLNDMNLSNSVSYTMGAGNYQASLKKAVDRVTEADIKEFATKVSKQREERAETIANIAKAVKDPKTLDDFHTYLRFKISDGKMTAKEARMSLTPEQRAAYDDLSAEKSRNERSAMEDLRKTDVRVAATTADGQIIETKHTKSGIDLFVVKAAERVDRDVYNQWNATAKRLGGYYSSFRGAGAVPGFQFKTRDNADAFLKFIGGNVEQAQEVAQARRDAFKDDRSQSAVERLNEMADKLEERADESLGQERKSNTARRARFAASAEAAAETNKALAATMRNIAKAIEDGKAKFLNRVRQKSQVEMLRAFVRRAQNDELRAKYPAYIDQEKHKGASPTSETIDYAEFPKYTAFRSDLARLGRELEQIDGTRKLGTAILKVADDVTDTYLKFAKEKLHLVSTFGRSDGKPAIFASRVDAEAAIKRSGYKGKAVVLPFKRNQNIIILSPSAAQEKGIWDGDQDKRITLTADAGAEIVAKVKAMGTRHRVSMPYIFENVAEDLARLKTMGIETPQEFRAALREFVGLRVATKAPDKIKEMERAMIGRRKDGLDFFPTPTSVAQDMIEAAGIEEGMAVLEPSAGMGHIAEQIRAAGVDPDVVEMSGDRRELLELKGFNVVGSDFMDMNPRDFTYGDTFRDKDGTEGVMRGLGGMGSNRVRMVVGGDERTARYADRDDLTGVRKNDSGSGYDRIIMNPPFSDRRDAEHVQHAYELLRPGGRLVALMGEGVFFGQDKKAVGFREWLEAKNGTSEKLEDGAFLNPSLPVNTGVAARMVVIDKVKEADSDAPQFSRESKPETFYSQMERAIDRLMAPSEPVGQLRLKVSAWAQKGEFKKEEYDWFGIDQWLSEQTGKITKEQVLDFIRKNRVEVREVTLGGDKESLPTSYDELPDSIKPIVDRHNNGEIGDGDVIEEAKKLGYWISFDMGGDLESIVKIGSGVEPTKFASYQLPGGENYRELLLTLPTRGQKFDPGKVSIKRNRRSTTQGTYEIFYDGVKLAGPYSDDGTVENNWMRPESEILDSARSIFERGDVLPDSSIRVENQQGNFRSSHFPEEPNILAHVRFNERTDADGKRVLFIEEVQSDWHQQGRKKGYGKSTVPAGWANTADATSGDKVPDAPFKTTWPLLAMKRMIRYAAENGFDRIAWTTGTQQADRYDLSKQIDHIIYGKENSLMAFDKNGDMVIGKTVAEKELEETIGKEAAKKLIEQKPNTDGERLLNNADLKVGGEGMKAFYDQMLPSMVNKYVKKWGGKVAPTTISTNNEFAAETDSGQRVIFGSRQEAQAWLDEHGEPGSVDEIDTGGDARSVPSIDITPAMRDSVLHGQPLFAVDTTKGTGAGISLPNGIDENLKEKAAALEAAGQSAGTFRITAGKLLDAVLEGATGQAREDLQAVKVLQDLFKAPVALLTSEGKFKFNGVYYKGVIWLDANSSMSLPLVFGHELSHRMKADNPSAYRALLKAISPMLRNVDAYEEKNNLYGMKDDLIAEEMLGDVMGDRFGEPEFWQQVAANTNRSEFHKIIDAIRMWVGRAIARLRGLGKDGGLGSKEFIGDLEAARKIIAKAVAEYAQTRKAGLSASSEPQFSRNTTPATESGAKAERDKMHAGILDAYRAKARKVVDRIDKALDPLGSLPESRAYLAKRYRTLGVIANADAIAKSIGKAFGTATPEDRIAVYDYLTTRDGAPAGIRNELVRAEAVKVKRMIESVGDAMVARGILSEDTREAHRGSYLPQLYLKWMLNESDVKLLGAGKKPGPMGYLKGRKIERTKGPDGEPQFVWRESGKPLTEEQTLDLGPISDPGFLAATAIATPIRDMALLDFLSHISQNEKWVLPNSLIEFDGTHTTPQWLKDEADRLRRQADHYGPEEAKKAREIADRMDTAANKALKEFGINTKDLKRYRQIPNTHKYGRLRGLWVRKEIYDDLVGVYDLSPADPGFVQSLLGYGGIGTKVTQLWKMGKVSLNPPAQVRNFVSNMVLLQLSGVPLHKIPGYIKKAVGEIANNGDHWKIAKKYGVTESTFATQELYRIRRDLLDLEMREGRLHTLGKIHRAGAIIADAASDAYQFMEALGKTIKIMHGMENGVSEAEAAIDAQKWLFDYSLVPKGVRYARNAPIGMPFITFQFKVLPRLAEVALLHPQRLIPWVTLFAGWPLLWAALAGEDDDEYERLQKAMPKWLQERGHAMILPHKDEEGRWQVVDLGYFMPWSMYTDLLGDMSRGELGEAAQTAGLFSGPVTNVIVAMKTGKDSFTGRDIMDPGDPPGRQFVSALNYAYDMMMPPIVSSRGLASPIGLLDAEYGGKIVQAATGRTNKYGDPTATATQTALYPIGINLYSLEPQHATAQNVLRLKYEVDQTELALKRKLQNRGLDDDARREKVQEYTDEIKRRNEKINEYLGR